MALEIFIANTTYSEQRVSVSGSVITLITKYNTRNDSWYIDIKDASGDVELISGLKVMPNQNLTGRYVLPDLPNGSLWCLRAKNDFTPINRDNFGIDKTYALTWIDNDEVGGLDVNGVIQL